MAYTVSPNKTEAGKTNFGGSVVDSNRIAMNGLGSNFQTRDGTGTPVNSPLTMTGSTQTLTVPPNATQVTINPVTTAVNVSEDSTMSVFFTIPAGGSQTFDVGRQGFIYLAGTSPNLTSFVFKLV